MSKMKRGLLYMHNTACNINGSNMYSVRAFPAPCLFRRVQPAETTVKFEASIRGDVKLVILQLDQLATPNQLQHANTPSLYKICNPSRKLSHPFEIATQSLLAGLKIFQNAKKNWKI